MGNEENPIVGGANESTRVNYHCFGALHRRRSKRQQHNGYLQHSNYFNPTLDKNLPLLLDIFE